MPTYDGTHYVVLPNVIICIYSTGTQCLFYVHVYNPQRPQFIISWLGYDRMATKTPLKSSATNVFSWLWILILHYGTAMTFGSLCKICFQPDLKTYRLYHH